MINVGDSIKQDAVVAIIDTDKVAMHMYVYLVIPCFFFVELIHSFTYSYPLFFSSLLP
jgi:hypothetical protein